MDIILRVLAINANPTALPAQLRLIALHVLLHSIFTTTLATTRVHQQPTLTVQHVQIVVLIAAIAHRALA